jgi:hypothetical protein
LEQEFAVGKGGHGIDASPNFWEGSGLKVDSASTDVVWCHGRTNLPTPKFEMFLIFKQAFNNKILTSARNGEIIMWDLNKSGAVKYGKYAGGDCFYNLMFFRAQDEGSSSLYPKNVLLS